MANILLIEDDPTALQALVITLEEDGHQVRSAENGQVGLALFDRESFDLVITDLIMPEVEGMEVLQTIKRNDVSAKVLVISGGGQIPSSFYLETAQKLGADNILAKPFSASELNLAVSNLLN